MAADFHPFGVGYKKLFRDMPGELCQAEAQILVYQDEKILLKLLIMKRYSLFRDEKREK